MAHKSKETRSKEGAAEKGSRYLRNFNAIGAVALAGLAVVLPPAVVPAAAVWAGVNAAQAGGYEVARKHFANKRKAKGKG
jgi:hypothetical protein